MPCAMSAGAPPSADDRGRRRSLDQRSVHPVQRGDAGRCRGGEHLVGRHEHDPVRDLDQPAAARWPRPASGRTVPRASTATGDEEERPRAQLGERGLGRRADERVAVGEQLAAQRDRARRRARPLVEQLQHRHRVRDDRAAEVSRAARAPARRPSGRRRRRWCPPGRPAAAACSATRVRRLALPSSGNAAFCSAARGQADPAVHHAGRRPVASSACRSRRTVMCETPSSRARSLMARKPTERSVERIHVRRSGARLGADDGIGHRLAPGVCSCRGEGRCWTGR